MSAAAIIDQARSMANELVLRESRGPGDMPNAMRRLESKSDSETRRCFMLRYRNPSGRIWTDVAPPLQDPADEARKPSERHQLIDRLQQ
jgi:hypothetical protein